MPIAWRLNRNIQVQIEYKVKDANFIVLTDSVGNEPEGETAKFYVLKSKKYTTYKKRG